MTSLLLPEAPAAPLVPVGDWHPTLCTPTLTGTEDYVTDGDRLLEIIDQYWKSPETSRFQLDPWQRWLIRRILERYPDDWPEERLRGQFRFRQVVVSMGRQNGKSILGAIFGFYGLLAHARGPNVLGLASSREQAEIVYKRTLYAIKNNPRFDHLLKPTGTRGISWRNGAGEYKIRPAKEDALQGEPLSMCLFDELHIAPEAMWGAVVNGQRARKVTLTLGITTAGDDDSVLLKRLYVQGEASAAEPAARFGFFLWEAPEGSTIEDDHALIAANPSIACGRVDLETAKDDARTLPEADQQRYTLNRFVGSVNAAMPVQAWTSSIGDRPAVDVPVVFGLQRTKGWTAASIVATTRTGETFATELVASLVEPDRDQLVAICTDLAERFDTCAFAMPSRTLSGVGKQLREDGHRDVHLLTDTDECLAADTAYARIKRGQVSHPGDELLTYQLPRAKRRNVGEAWRISAEDSGVDVDAVQATVYGVHVAELWDAQAIQFF